MAPESTGISIYVYPRLGSVHTCETPCVCLWGICLSIWVDLGINMRHFPRPSLLVCSLPSPPVLRWWELGAHTATTILTRWGSWFAHVPASALGVVSSGRQGSDFIHVWMLGARDPAGAQRALHKCCLIEMRFCVCTLASIVDRMRRTGHFPYAFSLMPGHSTNVF